MRGGRVAVVLAHTHVTRLPAPVRRSILHRVFYMFEYLFCRQQYSTQGTLPGCPILEKSCQLGLFHHSSHLDHHY
ncbi:hypothetical protein B9Z55_025840 [Caenorhabditis nigoni]|uniref:Uncharacterized protein n=1 Tax=Caenorhabditis nigoni TaxID=1611254 RepID=A0A2G5T0U7_9PELO|nr:hypothetical protein B9Z55_025840 [Caenorhabditis nigoni]